jgi:hypothetical protein
VPNAIKYNVSAETLALKKGNFWIGTGDVGKGPTSSTGYYNGITPPSGGYTIYLNKETGGPSIYTVTTEAQMVSLTNTIGAQSFTTSGQCLNWFATQTDKMVFNIDYPSIVTNGLVMNLDAGFTPSYPTTATTWYDVSSEGNNGTLTNGPTYSSVNGGSIVFDGADDTLTFGSPNITSSCTVNQWIQPLSGSATTMRTLGYVTVNSATATLYSQLVKNSNVWYHQVLVSGYQSGYAEEMNVYFQSNVTSFVQNNTPYNFTFTWERTSGVNSTLKTYLNGVYREQEINTNNYWVNTASLATATYNISNTYKGNISNTTFYNRALTSTEILQNYQATFTRFLGENIVTSGLVLYSDAGYPSSYPTTGTTWYDVSGYGNNGTLTNGPTYSAENGGSIVFDGIDDYVNYGNIIFNNQSTTTIDIWVNIPSMTVNQYIMSKGSAGDGISTFICYTGLGPSGGGSSYIRFSMGNQSSVNSTPLEFGNLNWGEWYNFTSTYDGSSVKGYKNATSPQTTPLSGNLYNTISPIYLGRSKYGNYAPCSIGNFKIYNRALTSTEILQNYNAQKSRFGL